MSGGGKGGGKKGGGIQVSDYNMSLHYGFCLGPVDAVKRIWIGEKDIGITEVVTANKSTQVNSPGLFGGDQSSGGIGGRICYMLGSPDQKAPNELASRLTMPGSTVPLTPDTCPGFRNVCSLLFTGDTLDALTILFSRGAKRGFWWGTNNPMLPSVWAEASRWPKVLDNNSQIGNDANPAYMIYEALVSPDWGLAMPSSMIDTDSFLAAAATLRTEIFGLSMQWTASTPIEDFVNEILNHIAGLLAVDPQTGKLFLRLIRGDYDVDSLPEINPGNATLSKMQRTSVSDTINEIIVTWTNPDNEQDETVIFHDNASIEIQGAIVSDSRNYYGIRNLTLAAQAAARELRNAALPLLSCDALVDRRVWSVKPGDVVKLVWPEEGIASVIMRVGPCDYGSPGNPRILLSLVQDAAAFGEATFSAPGTAWVDPTSEIGQIDFFRMDTVLYFVLARALGDQAAEQVAHPSTGALILAAQRALDVRQTNVLARGPDITGNVDFYPVGTISNQGHGYLGSGIAPDLTTDLWPLSEYVGPPPTAGMLVLITDGTNQEICAIETAVSGVLASSIVVRRGCLDTVPLAWPAGTETWIIDPNSNIRDTAQRAVGDEVEYKFLPVMAKGQIPPEDAGIEAVTLSERTYQPYRPANVAVDGLLFGPKSVRIIDVITVTWSTRNRLLETNQVLEWDEADVPPEDDQTTTIELWNDTTLVDTFAGLTSGSQTIDLGAYGPFVPGDTLFVKAYSVRDDLTSFSTVNYQLNVADSTGGYGLNYDLSYGRI